MPTPKKYKFGNFCLVVMFKSKPLPHNQPTPTSKQQKNVDENVKFNF